jgi:serine phosphatase RsbU (regulator of sigma subunit)
VYANEAAARLLGCDSVDEVLTAEPGALAARFTISHEDGRPVETADFPGRRLMQGESSSSLLTHSIRRDTGEARWLLTKATLTREPSGEPLAINIIEDVTDAKEAELRQRFLADAGQLLASSLDYEQTLERVARMIVPRLADWCAIDMVNEDGGIAQVAIAHVDPAKVELAHELRERYPPDMTATTGLPAIVRGGPAELYREIPDEMLVAAAKDDEHLRIIREVGLRSGMAVPMRLGSETLGAITFASAESGRVFDDDDLAFAQDLALRAATAIQNARLYEAQERVAHTLQASLLPERLPQLPGWEIHAAYQAGERGADVGGDFYDILPVASGHLIVLGDVTGKGIEAAALTSLVRHSARMAARFDPSPARVLSLVNQVLREQSRLSLVTAVCGLLQNAGDGARLTVASAGHPLPLLRRPGAGPEQMGDHGVLLGVEGEEDWTEVTVALSPGDTVLFYTDGVTETPGATARYGELRLQDAMQRADDGPVALVAEIERSLRDFQSGTAIDDRAMLALRFLGVQAVVA